MKKELKDLEDVHAIEVGKLMYGNAKATDAQLLEWGKDIAKDIQECDKDSVFFIGIIDCIDYLRKEGYRIHNKYYSPTNPYTPIVGVGKEEVLRQLQERINEEIQDLPEDEPHEFDEPASDINQGRSWQRHLYMAGARAALESYASQPIGKGADMERPAGMTAEMVQAGENAQSFEAYPKMQQAIMMMATHAVVPQNIWQQLTDAVNDVCAELNYLQAYPTTTPTTDWEKVESDVYNRIGFAEEKYGTGTSATGAIITYLKQHIGGGDSQYLTNKIAIELQKADIIDTANVNRTLSVIRNVVDSLTVPASEQVDENEVK